MQVDQTTTVLIADDHPLFRSAMRHALDGIIDGDIYEAEDLQQATDMLHENQAIELVFLDLTMPGNNGLTGLLHLRNQFPNTLVVIVSAQDDVSLIKKAVALGSCGYIPKSTPLPEIAKAVEAILNGETWLPSDVSLESESDNANENGFLQRMSQLTPHQFTVLKMMADGMLNKQIAYELSISESTVKQHASAVLRKLGVINRTQAGVLFKQAMQSDENA